MALTVEPAVEAEAGPDVPPGAGVGTEQAVAGHDHDLIVETRLPGDESTGFVRKGTRGIEHNAAEERVQEKWGKLRHRRRGSREAHAVQVPSPRLPSRRIDAQLRPAVSPECPMT